jgi:fatty acid elongase 3
MHQSLTVFPGFVYFASWTYFTSTYFQWLPNAGRCAGEEFAAFAGIGILSSYLFLFISFYVATYKKDGKPPSGRKAARRMSQAPLPDPHDLLTGKATHGNAKAAGNLSNGKAANGSAVTTGALANGKATRSRRA